MATTKLYRIEGIPMNERMHRSAEVTPGMKVPFHALTEGESYLWMAHKRLKMLAQWLPENRQYYERAMVAIENVLNNELHNGGVNYAYGKIPDSLKKIQRLVQKAANMTNPSIGYFAGRPKVGAINAPIDCQSNTSWQDIEVCGFVGESEQTSYQCWTEKRLVANPGYEQCVTDAEFINLLNQELPKSAHHFLYEFTPPDGTDGLTPNSTATIVAKGVLHKAGVSAMAANAGFSRQLFRGILDTAIMEGNSKKITGPIDAVQTYNYFKYGAAGINVINTEQKIKKMLGQDYSTRIGIAPALIPIILEIIKLVAIAITAIATVTAAYIAYKNAQLKVGQLASVGTVEFSPNGTDVQWTGGQIPDMPNDPNNPSAQKNIPLPLLIGGGAAALLLFNDKK